VDKASRGALPGNEALGRATIRRISFRLLPFLMLSYLISYLDRVNAGFAALTMNREVGLTATMFGFGGGIFFISYCIFEIPSNLALQRVGARRWIARIMISWGLVSAAMALTAGPISFVFIRFLLGAAEAGFVPGVILFLTYWFPGRDLARMVGLFMMANPLAGFIGSPISAGLLGLDGLFGLHGWQWLFIIEALPAILLGILCLVWLPDRPAQANWLTADQKTWLAARLDEDRARPKRVADRSSWRVLSDPRVLLMALAYAGQATASGGLALWQPQLLKSFGLSNFDTGVLNAIPFGLGAMAMYLGGLSSDARGERVLHTALATAVTALSLVMTLFVSGLLPTLLLLCLAVIGLSAARGPFWALSSEWLSSGSAAVGLAQINAIGNGMLFFTNYGLGAIRDATHSWSLALMPMATFAGLATIIVLSLGRKQPATKVRYL